MGRNTACYRIRFVPSSIITEFTPTIVPGELLFSVPHFPFETSILNSDSLVRLFHGAEKFEFFELSNSGGIGLEFPFTISKICTAVVESDH
jgi:hypothetical protein